MLFSFDGKDLIRLHLIAHFFVATVKLYTKLLQLVLQMLNMIKAVGHGQRVDTYRLIFGVAVLAILVVSLTIIGTLLYDGPFPHHQGRHQAAIKTYSGLMPVTAEKHDGMSTVVPASALQHSPAYQDLVMPNSHVLRPLREILKSSWLAEMKTILKNMTNRQVNMVVAESKYLPSLLNWLIAALIKTKSPLENVLIVALDERLHLFLHGKGVPSVYINRSNVIIPNARLIMYSDVWIIRLTIVRLLHYWGYDIANYDTDAIIIFKNIQPVLDKYWDSDVIGSEGIFHWRRWWELRPMFCMGFFLFRSSKKTGEIVMYLI